MAVDPELRRYYEELAERYAGQPTPVDARERRQRFEEVAALSATPDPDDVEVHALALDLPGRQLQATLFRPSGVGVAAPRLLVYFHGGGWVVGSAQTHRGVTARLCADTGCAVVSVDYRLAPEHPYPVPCDDAYEALLWLAQQRASLGLDPDFLAVGGDSAGGHLAVQAARRAHAGGTARVSAQLLVYPVTSPRMSTESYRAFAEGPGLTRDEMGWYWSQYAGDARLQAPQAMEDPLLHLMAPPADGERRATPPASVIVVAGHDVLRDDGLSYADHLVHEGAAVVTIEASGMTHGFARLQPHSARAREWMRRTAQSFSALIEEE
ncbi:alpha/beta hydrolase [Paracidovorax citrulli]